MKSLRIGEVNIGKSSLCAIIAELSAKEPGRMQSSF